MTIDGGVIHIGSQQAGLRAPGIMVLLGLILLMPSGNALREKNHYEFILPDSYVGWICVVFNDHDAGLQEDLGKAHLIPIEEDGTFHTRSASVYVREPTDTFFYKQSNPDGSSRLKPVPPDYVLGGTLHGGFMVSTPHGGLWFIFIGKPEIRAQVRFADWKAEVADRIKKYGTGDLGPPEPLPVPGRMR